MKKISISYISLINRTIYKKISKNMKKILNIENNIKEYKNNYRLINQLLIIIGIIFSELICHSYISFFDFIMIIFLEHFLTQKEINSLSCLPVFCLI
jgi:hypothetical protein